MVAARHSPLPTKIAPTFLDVVDHLMKLTAKSNAYGEQLDELEAKMLLVAGETSRSNRAVLEQMAKVTDATREMREALMPESEHRRHLITLPTIDVSEINEILQEKLNENELQKRRSDSLRAKKAEDEKRRDVRVAWLAFWGLFAATFLTELFRIVTTGKF
jgi:Fic family protein